MKFLRRPSPLTVNVGLARTGTYSFTQAIALLGLKPAHVWRRAEHDPKVFAAVLSNGSTIKAYSKPPTQP